MAIESAPKSLEIIEKRRTWRVEMFCELNDTYSMRAWRETVWLDAGDRSVIKVVKDSEPIVRTLTELAQTEPSALGVAQQIAKFADKWDEEEQARENAL
jgi:hypothetical protein